MNPPAPIALPAGIARVGGLSRGLERTAWSLWRAILGEFVLESVVRTALTNLTPAPLALARHTLVLTMACVQTLRMLRRRMLEVHASVEHAVSLVDAVNELTREVSVRAPHTADPGISSAVRSLHGLRAGIAAYVLDAVERAEHRVPPPPQFDAILLFEARMSLDSALTHRSSIAVPHVVERAVRDAADWRVRGGVAYLRRLRQLFTSNATMWILVAGGVITEALPLAAGSSAVRPIDGLGVLALVLLLAQVRLDLQHAEDSRRRTWAVSDPRLMYVERCTIGVSTYSADEDDLMTERRLRRRIALVQAALLAFGPLGSVTDAEWAAWQHRPLLEKEFATCRFG